MKKLKRIAFGIIAAAITLCSACAKAQKKDSIAKNLGELSWSNNITIEASLFSNAQKDSVIEISAQQTKADYHKFKLYSVGNGWKEVGSGGVTGASFANGEITVEKKSCTISVKLTEDDASSLKSGGMVLHGFGLSIKKMEMVNPASSTNAAQKAGKAQEKPSKQEKAAKSQNANLPFDLGNWKNFVVSAKDLQASGDFSIKISTSASSSEKNPSYLSESAFFSKTSSSGTRTNARSFILGCGISSVSEYIVLSPKISISISIDRGPFRISQARLRPREASIW